MDAEGFIVAAELTASSRDAASTLPALLDTIEVPIRRFTADGAYDHRSVYDQLSAAGTENVVIVIPPRRSAVSAGPTDGPWAQPDTALERIRQVGRREWQKESGYRQQARVGNSFFRYRPTSLMKVLLSSTSTSSATTFVGRSTSTVALHASLVLL